MKKLLSALMLLIILMPSAASTMFWTEFTMSVHIRNKSAETKRLYLEKGRILEIARLNTDYFQSVIITDGDGWVEIPPGTTVIHDISGICLNEGLKFPASGEQIIFTPFIGNPELVTAGSDQEEVHRITDFPRDNIQIIVAKGYSDSEKNGIETDREEAFKDAVDTAARESGFVFSSETVLENLRLLRTDQRIKVENKSIRLNKVIHEDYNEDTGEYLYIGEFEVRSKPSRPELK